MYIEYSFSNIPIKAEDAPNFVFAMDGGDLYCVKIGNTDSGMLEVHILRGNTYRLDDDFSVHRPTPIPLDDASNFVFAVDDGDLYCIKIANTDSGMLEVHVLKGDEFNDFSVHRPTPIPLDDVPNFVFAVDDGDLYCMKIANTDSGMLEVHVLKGDEFNDFSVHRPTPIPLDDVPNFVFAVDDGDLYCVKTGRTAGFNTPELHVCKGDKYGYFLSHHEIICNGRYIYCKNLIGADYTKLYFSTGGATGYGLHGLIKICTCVSYPDHDQWY